MTEFVRVRGTNWTNSTLTHPLLSTKPKLQQPAFSKAVGSLNSFATGPSVFPNTPLGRQQEVQTDDHLVGVPHVDRGLSVPLQRVTVPVAEHCLDRPKV